MKVHRGPFYVPQTVSGYTRLLHDFSFLASSAWTWMRKLPRNFDVVLCIYPPLPIGIFPLLYKWLRGTPFVFHVQDLQVDAARQLGIIRRPGLLSFLEKFERYFMQRANLVTTISPGMQEKILKKGIAREKVQLFPNWVNTAELYPMEGDERLFLKQKYGYRPEDQVVLYSGNLGEKQGLDCLLHTAALAQRQNYRRLKFHIVGEGAVKQQLLKLSQELGLQNVRFAPLVPKAELGQLLNMADLHVILQKKGATDLVMPSKLSSILACGGIPLVGAEAGSGLRQEVERYRMGVCTEPEDAAALLGSITRHLRSASSGMRCRKTPATMPGNTWAWKACCPSLRPNSTKQPATWQ